VPDGASERWQNMRQVKDKDQVFKGKKAKEYEQFQKAVPHHDQFQNTIRALVGEELSGLNQRLCEIGVGTGVTLSLVWNDPKIRKSIGRLFAVDISSDMIRLARDQHHDPLISFVNQDILDFLGDPKNAFNGFYSAYTIHNSPHEIQTRIYKRVYGSLLGGGFFVHGDLFGESDPDEHKKILDWQISMFKRHLDSPQREDWVEHYYADQKNYFTLDQALELLKRIGFSVEVRFREKFEAVILARKP